MSIASVCRSLPNPSDSSSGIFVLRRLQAMAKLSNLTAIQPIPYFPFVVSPPSWGKTSNRVEATVNIVHAPMFYIPKFLKFSDGYWLYRAVLKSLSDLKTKGRLDIVDAHFGYPEGVGAMAAAKKLGVPCVVTLRGFEAEYIERPMIGGQLRHLFQDVDGCICVGHSMKELALNNGANPATTKVIHNAIDDRLFFPADRREMRQKLGLEIDAQIVVSVGHLIERKRHHNLVSAFAAVLEDQPDAKLLIIGNSDFDPVYAGRLRRQIASLGIGNAVELLGNVDAGIIGDYLRAANVFALGTQREGCCNAVLEAIACGLPVVTTPVGDNSWFVEHDRNGYLVPVDDIPAMAAAISVAVERSDWDRDRIAAGLGVGAWDRVAAEVLEFFESVVPA